MFKNIKILCGLVLMVPAIVHGEETTKYGIGAVIGSGTKLYAPIYYRDWLIEPTLYSYVQKANGPGTSTIDHEFLELGVGVFKHPYLSDKTYGYYGARVGGSRWEDNHASSPLTVSNSKGSGYFIAPTVGAEYELTTHFSLGLDLSYDYKKFTGDIAEINSSTETKVIARYFF